MTDYKPKKGDRFRVVLEGEATTDVRYKDYVWMGSSYIHLTGAQAVSVEQIKPALQVGWHRVLPEDSDGMEVVTAMYWSGTDWKYNESTTRSSFNRWTPLGYLGTGVKA